MISFACPKCGKRFTLADNLAGRKGKCPGCQTVLEIPAAPLPTPGQAPVPPPQPRPLTTPPAVPQAPAPTTAYQRPRYTPPTGDDLLYAGEDQRRKRNLTILGVVLLVGFFMPVFVRTPVMSAPRPGQPFQRFEPRWETKVVFPFVELFRAKGEAPWEVYVVMLAPLVAGLIVLPVARLADPPARGLVLILLAVLPVGVLMFSEEVRQGFAGIGSLLPSGEGAVLMTGILGQLGLMALLVGARTRWYRPAWAVTYWIGLGGAAAYLVHLVLPVLPAEQGRMTLANTFMALRPEERTLEAAIPFILRFAPVLGLLCFVAASIVCLLNTKSSPTTVRNRALAGFWLLVGSVAGTILCVLIGMGQLSRGEGLITLISAMIWALCMVGGMFLLIPVGLIDLIVGKAPPAQSWPVPGR